MKNRMISFFLALCMVFSMVPVTAFAAETVDSGTCGDNLTWTLDAEGTLTISGTGEMNNYTFANAPPNRPTWYSYRNDIVSVIIENGVTSLGDCTFADFINLESIRIPSSVTRIGYAALYNCESLTSIVIPNGVTSIGKSAFNGCDGLASITIPSSVTSIGDYAFAFCKCLTSIDLPEGVTSIGADAFYYCSGLISIKIPDTVTSLGSGAFYRCSYLKNVELSKSMTSIQSYLFFECVNLSSVSIHNSVTSIGESAFEGCSSLTGISIPNGVTSIGGSTFEGCSSLTSITIPSSVTRIGSSAFDGCSSMKDLYITDIAAWADIVFGHWDANPFGDSDNDTNLYVNGILTTDLVIPEGVSAISDYAFYEFDSLTSVTIPNSVTSIGRSAFYGCSNLTNITIPNSVTSIGEIAFRNCSGLTSITIPNSVTSIEDGTFKDCSSLTGITIPNSVTSIGGEAFAYCYSLTGISIPNSVTSIDSSAFYRCSGLTSITIPNSVISIGESAFRNCSGLTSITIPNSVTSIGGYAFRGCDSLTDITIPNSVTSIGDSTFYYCISLTDIAIPNSVTSIGNYAFAYCYRLTSIVFKGDAPPIDNKAFEDVTANAYYPVDNATWTTEVMKSYGGNITWIPYMPDGSDTITADSLKINYMPEVMLVIKPALAENSMLDAVNNFIMDPEMTVTSSLGEEVIPDGGYMIKQNDATAQNITIKRPGYRDYIIPTEVSGSFTAQHAVSSDKKLYKACDISAYMQKDRNDGKPYLSTIFGRQSGEDEAYRELKHSELKLYPGDTHDIIISAVNMEGEHPTYYIGQDGDRRVESKTGVFSAEDLYNEFVYGKDVYAYAITESGEATEREKLKITLVPKQGEAMDNFISTSEFSLVGKKGQTIKIDESWPVVGGAEFDISAFRGPIGISVHGEDVKISFGVDLFSQKYKPNTPVEETELFESFKKSFKTMNSKLKSADDELEMYRHFKEKYAPDYKNYKTTSQNFDIEFLGYAEATLVNGELVFKDILLNVKGKFTFNYTAHGVAWVIPYYYYVEAGAGIGLTSQWARQLADKDIPLDFGLILDVEPELTIGGGVGVKDAISGGVYGKGMLPYSNDFSKKYHVLKIAGELGLEGEFLVFSGKLPLLDGEYTLFETYYGSAAVTQSAPTLLSGAGPMEIKLSVASRDYAANTSEWLGGYPAISTFAVAANGVSFRDLQNSIFSQSQPQVAPLGDGLIMTWAEDDPARDAYNRMRLVFSVYDSESDTWSSPQPVCDDGHNDAFPSLVSDGTNAYVTWQKINKTITEEDCQDMNAVLENSEIYAAKFNVANGCFDQAVKLTDNRLYEYAATAAIENDELAVYYTAVESSKVNESGTHAIYRQTMTATPDSVADFLNYILSIDARNGQVSYTMDSDGNAATTADIGAFTINQGTVTSFPKEENTAAYTTVRYADMNGTSTLFVTDMSNIYYLDGGTKTAVLEDNRAMSGNFHAIETATGTILLWTEQVEGWNELFAVKYEDGAWTKPVKISSNEKLLSAVDVTTLNGKLVGVCNANAVSYDSESEQYLRGDTDLCYFTVNDFMDVAISEYVTFDETLAEPGSTQPIEVIITNKGTMVAEEVTFEVTDTLGTSYVEAKTMNLLPGETQAVELAYPVPESYAETTVQIFAYVAGYRDADDTDNTAALEIGKPDLYVKEQTVHTFEDGYIVNAVAENRSALESTGVSLSVILDDENNTPIYTQDVGALSRESYASLSIAIGKDMLTFDDAGVAKIYIRVESDQTDAADADNISCLLIAKPNGYQCEHVETESVEGCEPGCETAGHTPYERCSFCGEPVSGYEEIAALGHSYLCEVIEEPDTTKTGKLTGTCSRCQEEIDVMLPALNTEDYTYAVTQEPTYTQAGIGTYTWKETQYGTFSFTVTLEKLIPELVELSIASYPDKLIYEIGEPLDISGLTLTATYSDGSVKTINSGYRVSSFDSSIAGEKTITVNYEGRSTTFKVTVLPMSAEDPRIVVSNENAVVGTTVNVTISLKNNPGITSMLLEVGYDPEVLELVSVTDAGKLGEAGHSDNYGRNPYVLSWENDLAKEDFVVDGEIVTLTFQVAENAPVGETAVTVSYTCDNYDIFNAAGENVWFATVNGSVNVIDVLLGDVNSDGKVNAEDRLVLTRYLAKWTDYPASLINMDAADVNCDGKVNAQDRLILTRHLAGWIGYETLG